MKKTTLKLYQVRQIAQMFGKEIEEISAIQHMSDGSKMTATLYILRADEAPILNISNCLTLTFDSVKELDNLITKKFTLFKSDKEKWQSFTGMDDETWEEWNK